MAAMSPRKLVRIVGNGAYQDEVHMRLLMYRSLSVARSDTQGALQSDLAIAAPDCVCAVVKDRNWGRELVAVLRKVRGPMAVVLLFPKLYPDITTLMRHMKALCTHGKRGLAARGAQLVARSLSLPARPPLQLPPGCQAWALVNGVRREAKLVDLTAHGAIFALESAPEGDVEALARPGQLHIRLGRAEAQLSGTHELVQVRSSGLFAMLRFDEELSEVPQGLGHLMGRRRRTRSTVPGGHRARISIISQTAVLPRIKFSALLMPRTGPERFYYAIEMIDVENAMLGSTGRFDCTLAAGTLCDIRVKSPRGQVVVPVRVDRILPVGWDAQRPEHQGLIVSFVRESEQDTGALERLMRHAGVRRPGEHRTD